MSLGEVVEATSTGFTVHCRELGAPPPLGSLVVAEDGATEIYGVVHNAATTSIDPSRRVMALAEPEQSEDDLRSAHPELNQLLRTDFQALVVAHRRDGALRPWVAPRPAQVHGFVRLASEERLREVAQDLGFLHLLVNAPLESGDASAVAFLRLAADAQPDRRDFLVLAGKELARLLARDSQRLNALLRMLSG